MKQRIHFILLGVENLTKSTLFYDNLGWKKAHDSHSGFIKYDLDGYVIALISLKDLAKDALEPIPKTKGFSGMVLVHLVKKEEDVTTMLDKAVQAGGTLVKPATTTPYGVAGYFKDPDGYLFEIDYEEKFKFDDHDHLITN